MKRVLTSKGVECKDVPGIQGEPRASTTSRGCIMLLIFTVTGLNT